MGFSRFFRARRVHLVLEVFEGFCLDPWVWGTPQIQNSAHKPYPQKLGFVSFGFRRLTFEDNGNGIYTGPVKPKHYPKLRELRVPGSRV